jgi:hypothetical protein
MNKRSKKRHHTTRFYNTTYIVTPEVEIPVDRGDVAGRNNNTTTPKRVKQPKQAEVETRAEIFKKIEQGLTYEDLSERQRGVLLDEIAGLLALVGSIALLALALYKQSPYLWLASSLSGLFVNDQARAWFHEHKLVRGVVAWMAVELVCKGLGYDLDYEVSHFIAGGK